MTTTLPRHLHPERRGTGRAFWEGAALGELRVPRCTACRTFSWPPRLRCPACDGGTLEWMRASGRGRVHTFTIVRQAADPYFKSRVPYVVAMIELEEGLRIMSTVVDATLDSVRIGTPVTVVFVDVGEGLVLPAFKPLGNGASR